MLILATIILTLLVLYLGTIAIFFDYSFTLLVVLVIVIVLFVRLILSILNNILLYLLLVLIFAFELQCGGLGIERVRRIRIQQQLRQKYVKYVHEVEHW